MSVHQVSHGTSLLLRYHALRQSGEPARADELLQLALQVPEYRPEALIWRGLDALQAEQPQHAFLLLAKACEVLEKRSDLVALLAHCAQAQERPRQALALLQDAWCRNADDETLRLALLKACQATCDTSPLLRRILEQADTLQQGNAMLQPGSAGLPDMPQPARDERLPAADSLPVDILIPVYDGLAETLACIDSVLDNRRLNRTPQRLVVLDDASPNRKLVQRLQALARKGRITYIRQPHNLGFIGNMNCGMRLHSRGDVVWLNADTRVHGDWLDRLRDTAYQSGDIASVTPLTNNGELMSFPVSCVSQPMPDPARQAELDTLARQLAQPALEIETGCGFCLYIKRQALDTVGYLDEIHLQRGYGEETDWCQRARMQGWKHMGAVNVFVAHQGGISFGSEKSLRVAQNNALLRRRYPEAEQRYTAFYLRDPLRPARDTLQRARLPGLARRLKKSRTLHITPHGHSTATLRLEYRNQGQHSLASLRLEIDDLPLVLDYRLPADIAQLHEDLAQLPLADWQLDYRGHCPSALLEMLEQSALPGEIALHDTRLFERPALLRKARHVRLPWHTLLGTCQASHPQINWQVQPRSECTAAPRPAAPPCALLIADRPSSPQLTARWRHLARALQRQRATLQLLLPADTPLDADLLKLGNLHRLPDIDGLTAQEVLSLCGCNAALSLDDAPTLDWPAPELAAQYGLPLYAPDSAIAHEAAALPLAELLASTGLTNVLEA